MSFKKKVSLDKKKKKKNKIKILNILKIKIS